MYVCMYVCHTSCPLCTNLPLFTSFSPPHSLASIVHVTCFERDTKIMGLKAANSYWNPFYYDPRRATITKKLLVFNKRGTVRGRRGLSSESSGTYSIGGEGEGDLSSSTPYERRLSYDGGNGRGEW